MITIYRVARIDDGCNKSWGNNVAMVAATETGDALEELITQHLLHDVYNDRIETEYDDPITREHIEVTSLGTSEDIEPGLILLANAGD